jgi:nitroreductase / dihydropteridine reductase
MTSKRYDDMPALDKSKLTAISFLLKHIFCSPETNIMEFQEIVKLRYAVKKFNGIQIPKEEVNQLIEVIRLAPSAFGLQPWKVKIINDKENKEKLLEATWYQAQIASCSHLLIFCADNNIAKRIDKYEEMLNATSNPSGSVQSTIKKMRDFEMSLTEEQKLSWAQRQIYLALANAVNGAKALGFDSCPMEGFQPEKYSALLELDSTLTPTALVTIGYSADQAPDKIRFPKDDLFF